MITLIGTGHVFKLSSQLLNIFDSINPDVLCVELDNQRYQSLMMKQHDPEQYKQAAKNLPYIYRRLAGFQEEMAKRYGVQPGDEMLTTINYAHTHQIPLVCIDMNAQNMFKKMIKDLSLSEKTRFFLSGIGSIFVPKKNIDKEVKNITNNVESYLSIIGKKFPTIKKVLIDDRNTYMTNNLLKLHQNYDNIIAILGDGHIKGIENLLLKNNITPKIIRLKELQETYSKEPEDQSSASFHVEYQPFSEEK